MALSAGNFCNFTTHSIKHNNVASYLPRFQLSQKHQDVKNIPTQQIKRRELILRSGELATIGAIFNLSGKKPDYLGVQKNPPSLALCPSTKNCISTSENVTNLTNYAPPWNYNPEGRNDRVRREEAIEELIDAIETTIPPENFTSRIVERTEDYLRVEYQSPIMGFVDDVEFWFPPEKDSIVEYRSASRRGDFDFDVNRKRIKNHLKRESRRQIMAILSTDRTIQKQNDRKRKKRKKKGYESFYSLMCRLFPSLLRLRPISSHCMALGIWKSD